MSKQAPKKVWVSWCDECGKPDYAYDHDPKPHEISGCPRCETGPEYTKTAGPYSVKRATPHQSDVKERKR